MSMGYAGNMTTVISQDNLSALCPQTFYKFFEGMALLNLDEQTAFLFLNEEEPDALGIEDGAEVLTRLWKELQADFAEKTTMPNNGKHLNLYCGYHDLDNGSCYDDIDGAFFSVGGVYERSQAGEVFRDILEDVSFVTFG